MGKLGKVAPDRVVGYPHPDSAGRVESGRVE
jgi:hypothetical protein